MRCTAEILSDVKDGLEVTYEELRLAILVMDSINFFNHRRFQNLLKGGVVAEMEKKQFPGACAQLGISKQEHNALHADPVDYLGPDHIPGTPEYEHMHQLAQKLLYKVLESTKKDEV